MNNFKDYYKILGIKKDKLDLEMKRRREKYGYENAWNFIQKIINQGYKKKILKLHSDKNKSPIDVREFQLVREAYSILSKQYDKGKYDYQ